MAFGDTGHKAKAAAVGVVSLNVVLTGTTAGNLVVVITCFNRAATSADATVTDGGNTWTKETGLYNDPQGISCSWSVLTTGGDRTINTSINGVNSYDIAVFAHEFSGPAASPKSGVPITASGNSAASDTGSMTPADSDALMIAAESDTSGVATTENQTPGATNWTLSNENEGSATGGSMVFFIESGAAVARRAAWSITTNTWATFIMGFKPSVAAPDTLMGAMLIG